MSVAVPQAGSRRKADVSSKCHLQGRMEGHEGAANMSRLGSLPSQNAAYRGT